MMTTFAEFADPSAMYQQMLASTSSGEVVRNFAGSIVNMSAEKLIVETDLFPREALEFYTRFNLNLLDPDRNPVDSGLHRKYYSPARGGGQGDYREQIQDKIANVIACLRAFPQSKRAVITIPNKAAVDHTVDEDAKCLRELHFYLDARGGEELRLHCTGFMRAQAASIFGECTHS